MGREEYLIVARAEVVAAQELIDSASATLGKPNELVRLMTRLACSMSRVRTILECVDGRFSEPDVGGGLGSGFALSGVVRASEIR